MKNLCWILGMVLVGITSSYAQLTEWERSLTKVYDEGKILYEQQLYAAASERFQEVMDKSPYQKVHVVEKSEFYRAMCAVRLMNRDAQNLVEGFLLNHPTSSYRYDVLWATADFLFNRRNYSDALEWLNKMDSRNLKSADRPGYYFKKGYSHMMLEQSAEAKTAFREIKDGNSNLAPSARYYYAHLNYVDSNYVTALAEFEGLRDDAAFGPMVPYYLAQIYYQTGEDEKLFEVGSALLDNATPSRAAEIAKLVGQSLFRQKRYEEALPYLELYRERGGAMRQQEHYQMGVCYHAVSRYREAVESLNKVTANNRDLAQSASYLLADSYLRTDDKNQALSAFKVAMEVSGDARIREEAHFNYAKLSYELANPFENAIKALTDFQETYPNSVHKRTINEYLANLYLTTKDYDNALEAISASGLETAVMRETYQKVSYYRGVEYFNAMQWDKALEMFAQSLKYPVNSGVKALAHYWTGEVLYRKKDYAGALVEYKLFQNQSGAQSMSEYPLSLYNVAYTYFMTEDYASASRQFRLFLDNRRSDAARKLDATLRLADSYFMQSRYGQATPYYSQYIDGRGREGDYAGFQRALSYGLNNQRDQKITELRRVLQAYPESPLAMNAHYELGASLLRSDRNDEALQEFISFRRKHPNTVQARRAQLQIGVIQRNKGDYDASIRTFKDLVAEHPNTDEARAAISFARLVYDRAERIEEYLDWVKGISFADVEEASLDSTLYNSAYEKYGMGSCTEAIPAFESYLQRYPNGIFRVQANFFLAECSIDAENLVRAREAYQGVVSGPANDYTERAWLQLGHIALVQNNYSEALTAYNEVVQSAQNTDRYNAANLGRMRASVELNQWANAVRYAESVLSNSDADKTIINEAKLVQARGLWREGRDDDSRRIYAVLRNEARGEARAEASYHVALWHHREGQYEDSNNEIFWMIDNLPSYQNWRYKALLILAQNYWKLDDIFQAQYTLDFIIEDNYSADIVSQAKALKEKIEMEVAQKETGTLDPNEIEVEFDDSEADEPAETDQQ